MHMPSLSHTHKHAHICICFPQQFVLKFSVTLSGNQPAHAVRDLLLYDVLCLTDFGTRRADFSQMISTSQR